jgi:hypothetical protein
MGVDENTVCCSVRGYFADTIMTDLRLEREAIARRPVVFSGEI